MLLDKETLEEILSHLDGIIEDIDRMTSGNFMRNKHSVKFRAKVIKDLLENNKGLT